MRKIVFFELNEVPHRIIEEFCRWRPESTMAKVLPQCHAYETYAEDDGILSPWITWPTVHRGVTNRQHMIGNFGQDLRDVDAEYPPIWKVLVQHGIDTAVCGSLHSYPMPANHAEFSFYLPDTFAAGSECFPADLSHFQEFNLRMARESARNVSDSVDWQAALAFLSRAPGLGLKPRTMMDIGKQLVSERAARWKKVRRRTYQSVLAFDIFEKYLAKKRPAFSTFFTNHVASSLHRYWAARFPGDYREVGYDREWIDQYAGEIEFTMDRADRFLSRLVAFAKRNPEYQIWMLSSMGQAATEAEPVETQLYLKDRNRFMSQFDLADGDWREMPAMLPRYVFQLNKEKADRLEQLLPMLLIAGQTVEFGRLNETQVYIKLGQRNLHKQSDCVLWGNSLVSVEDLGLAHVEIEDMSNTTAYHIPQGTLFIYDPTRAAPKGVRSRASTVEIAPAIMKNFGLPVPSYMTSPSSLATH